MQLQLTFVPTAVVQCTVLRQYIAQTAFFDVTKTFYRFAFLCYVTRVYLARWIFSLSAYLIQFHVRIGQKITRNFHHEKVWVCTMYCHSNVRMILFLQLYNWVSNINSFKHARVTNSFTASLQRATFPSHIGCNPSFIYSWSHILEHELPYSCKF